MHENAMDTVATNVSQIVRHRCHQHTLAQIMPANVFVPILTAPASTAPHVHEECDPRCNRHANEQYRRAALHQIEHDDCTPTTPEISRGTTTEQAPCDDMDHECVRHRPQQCHEQVQFVTTRMENQLRQEQL